MLAAYLGFTNTSGLRTFAISRVCLAAEKYFRKSAKGMRKNVPFKLLSKATNKNKLANVITEPETTTIYERTRRSLQRTTPEENEFLQRHASKFAILNLTFSSETVGFPSPNFGPHQDTNEGELEVWPLHWKTRFGSLTAVNTKRVSFTAVNYGTTVNWSTCPTWMQTPGEKVDSGLEAAGSTLRPTNFHKFKLHYGGFGIPRFCGAKKRRKESRKQRPKG
ncbi:SNF2-like protein [Penicillium cf. griseofulvum]|uniref:SNF2-like protein n=1 Tax=Penicillium cf. griseofulvum TaxID=2972120 RepID=A0A9W9IQE7_9EURO|nr:SNF2-like protein [Penicillium cf. griseofulvum]KAJ5451557.1 SNF2-like protein [Penicillium cf. griseofulvum]